MRYGVIYMVTCKVNRKRYIGQALNFRARKIIHKCEVERGTLNFIFYRAIRKYGWESFKWMIIEEDVPEDKLNEREIYCIKQLRSKHPNGYNMTDGGEGARGRIVSEKTRRKMKEKRSKRSPITEETRRRMRESRRLRPPHSEETKRKIRESSRLYLANHPEVLKCMIERIKEVAKSNKGTKRSEETKIKMSLATKGKVVSDETKAKIRKTCSDPEWRKRRSDERKQYYKNNPDAREKLSEMNQIKILPSWLVRQYIDKQKSGVEIAKMIDVHSWTIINRLRELGVRIRTPWEQRKCDYNNNQD